MILCYIFLLSHASIMILRYTFCQTHVHLTPWYPYLSFPSGGHRTNKLLVNASNLSMTDYVGNQEYMQFLIEHPWKNIIFLEAPNQVRSTEI